MGPGGRQSLPGWVLTNCGRSQPPHPNTIGSESPEGSQAKCHHPCLASQSVLPQEQDFLGGVRVWFTPGEGRGLQRQENVGDFAVVLESEDWGKDGEAMVTPVPGGHCDVPNRLFLKRGTQRTHNPVSVEQDSC